MNFYDSNQPRKMKIIEKVLAEVYDCKLPIKNQDGTLSRDENKFFGKLGADVAFYGTRVYANNARSELANEKYPDERIKFLFQKKVFANVNVKHVFILKNDKQEASLATSIQFFSPRCGKNDMLTKEKEGLKQLQIFHAPDETADEVIDAFYDTIAYSMAKRLADVNQERQC